MAVYFARRVIIALPTLFLAALLIFSMTRLVPGDAVSAQLAEAGGALSAKDTAALRHQLGLDRPYGVQLGSWLEGVSRGDLGKSLWSSRSVSATLAQSLPVTLELALLSLLISVLIAVPLAVGAALFPNSLIDSLSRLIAVLGISIPSFVSATLVLVLGGKYLGWAPPLQYHSFFSAPLLNLEQFIIPALILGYILAGAEARMLRSSLIEVLNEDYIRTAKAKGMRSNVVVMRHAMRNALIPTLTITGTQFGTLLGGTVIVETIFSLPGLGRLLVDSVLQRDYPVIQGTMLVVAAFVIAINILVDMLYAVIDPRVRL